MGDRIPDRISGNYGSGGFSGGSRTRINATDIAATPRVDHSTKNRNAEGIASTSSTTVMIQYYSLADSSDINTSATFDDIELRQVVYNPQLDILESDLFILTKDSIPLALAILYFIKTPAIFTIDPANLLNYSFQVVFCQRINDTCLKSEI